jgi:hypothetical protein
MVVEPPWDKHPLDHLLLPVIPLELILLRFEKGHERELSFGCARNISDS